MMVEKKPDRETTIRLSEILDRRYSGRSRMSVNPRALTMETPLARKGGDTNSGTALTDLF